MLPQFLTVDEVMDLHADALEMFGGAPGLRSMDLLESALAQPGMTFGGVFLHSDVFEMAAAYLYHVALNHPFVDGNKRAALAACLTFLALNGYDIGPEHTEALYALALATAEAKMQKAEIATALRGMANAQH